MPLSKSKIQLYKGVHHPKGRRTHRLFLVEGPDLIKEALKEGWKLREILVTHHFAADLPAGRELIELAELAQIPWTFCSSSEMHRIADAQTPQGIVALAELPDSSSAETGTAPEILLICERVSDPGNLGTLIRTADWFGLTRIIIGKGSVDPYNPKVVRSTAGSLFRVRIEMVDGLRKRVEAEASAGRKLYAAVLDGQLLPRNLPVRGPRGLILGHERRGVSREIADWCADTVRIENRGCAESLNLAVAAGILLHALTIGE